MYNCKGGEKVRRLNTKQKNIIISYIKDDYFNRDCLIDKYGNYNILLMQLEKINDYETLNDDLQRLTTDLIFCNTLEEKIQKTKNFI